MQKNHSASPIRKIFPALIATLGMTVFIGLAFLALGLNAFFNQKVSVAQAAAQPDPQLTANQATIQDLQATISQYQSRETQYQNDLKQAADQINQINQQNLQYQQLIQALQNAGVIRINQDGQVFILPSLGAQSRFGDDD
jgi:septal ring factor EnvC (AmiA/AmiB activator)